MVLMVEQCIGMLRKSEIPPNKACTGRLGLCAFLEVVLNDGSFPFRELVLSSRR
jgi:hypothetical protein